MSAIFGETLTFAEGDGSTVELKVFGDEFYARYETAGGHTVVFDTDLRRYCYAMLVRGRFASSGAPMAKGPPPGLRRHLKESGDVRNKKFDDRYGSLRPPEPPAATNAMRTLGRAGGLLDGRRVSEGDVTGLTVLVQFADVTSTVRAADVEALLNGQGYTADGNYCSVNEYFRLVSDGKLNYSNRVVGPVTLSQNRSHYITTSLVEEALTMAVNDIGVDLGEFDSRNEGIVDAVSFMYAGRTLYEGDLWPHNWTKELTFNGIRIHYYMLTSLGRSAVDLSIGTFCHESGHLLCRFPDLYDYGKRDGDFERSHGIGRYCLMGSGNHLDRGRTPSPVCGYLRDLVGWTGREVRLNPGGDFQARHNDYGTVLKYETDDPNEYFVVENRGGLGLDAHLPDAGLAVYHCDTLGSNEWQGGTSDRHYQVGVLQADGHLDLENNVNGGDEGDLFGQAETTVLSHETTPSSRQWDGADSGLVIADVSAPGQTVSFRVGESVRAQVAAGLASPDLLIPDNKVEGIRSAISIGEAGMVRSVRVTVDISHTYVGDLEVELEAPSGRMAMLHGNASGRQDDIRATFGPGDTPSLAALRDEGIAGDWVLHVRDEAPRDVGRLNSWGIEIDYETVAREATGEASPNLAIPDNDHRGVVSVVSIADSGEITGVRVRVEITHTYVGDLRLQLTSPAGQCSMLHNAGGGNRQDLKETYDMASTPDLADLAGQQMRGDWVLRVTDTVARDTGVLERWTLELTY